MQRGVKTTQRTNCNRIESTTIGGRRKQSFATTAAHYNFVELNRSVRARASRHGNFLCTNEFSSNSSLSSPCSDSAKNSANVGKLDWRDVGASNNVASFV